MPAGLERFVKIAPHWRVMIAFESGQTGPAPAAAPDAQSRAGLNSFAAASLR
jgi:hypothetical protein